MSIGKKSLSPKECAKLLKALAEEMRLQILQCLFKGEHSVSDVAKELGEEHYCFYRRILGKSIDK